jgi:hypothetical protein
LEVGGEMPTVTLTRDGGDPQTFTPASADGCEEVPGRYAGGTLELCTSLTVTLPEGGGREFHPQRSAEPQVTVTVLGSAVFP